MHMLCMQRLHREGKQHKGLVASGQLAMEFLAFLLTQGSSTDIQKVNLEKHHFNHEACLCAKLQQLQFQALFFKIMNLLPKK